jgi:hypothetical protein
MVAARRRISFGSSGSGPSEPGTHGMPTFFIAALAAILSPMVRIEAAVGPMKTKPEFSTLSAKSAFSDRNP